jgi:CheY-like chemotaxis protein
MSDYFLYAEDDLEDVAILSAVVQATIPTSRLVCVSGGFEAIQYLQEVAPNQTYPCLIILDFSLPKMNGLETLRLLKTDDVYRLIPVLIFSVHLSDRDESQCLALGAGVLRKPIDNQDWNVVREYLHSYVDEP